MMTYDENRLTQRPAGVIDHARPDRDDPPAKANEIQSLNVHH